jgi:hypothetical protein
MGGRGRVGGREGGGFEVVGIKVGGMGNSLRRIGTSVLRLCLTEDKDMIKVKGQGVNVCGSVFDSQRPFGARLRVIDREEKRRRHMMA